MGYGMGMSNTTYERDDEPKWERSPLRHNLWWGHEFLVSSHDGSHIPLGRKNVAWVTKKTGVGYGRYPWMASILRSPGGQFERVEHLDYYATAKEAKVRAEKEARDDAADGS